MSFVPLLVGLDLGTTHFKALAIDEKGHPRASASLPTPATDEGEGRVVYEPDAVWGTVCRLLRSILEQVPRETVAGVACASMGEAGFLLDEAGQPLWPAIAWFDPRTRPLEAWWREHADLTQVRATTGLSMDFTYSLMKLMWYRQADPQRFARARHWLGISEWVAYRLSGRMMTDYSLASRTMALDLRRETWAEELLSLASLPSTLLAPLAPAGTPLGPVTEEAARQTGLSPGAVVSVGGHDHICAALATGAVTPGIMLNSCGTAETMLSALGPVALPKAVQDERVVVGHHLFQGLYYTLASMRTSGLSADWFVRHLLTGPRADHESLAHRAEASPVGARGLLFFPYLRDASDERHAAASSGAIVGLRDYHDNADVARALLEGLAFEARRMFERIASVIDEPVRALRAVGGSTANPVWMQIKADVLGIEVDVLAVREATAYGAALLAGLGAGLFAGPQSLPSYPGQIERRYIPDPERHRRYQALYGRYISLLPLIVDASARLEEQHRRKG